MANFDVFASDVLWKYCIPVILFCLLFGLNNLNDVKQKFQVWCTDYWIPFHKEIVVQNADEAFRVLHTIRSADAELQKIGGIRVLEIGAGRGRNLRYMPRKCHLIVLETNRLRYCHFVRKLQRYPHVVLRRYLLGNADNMSAVETGCIDAVIATGVLCSVDNLAKALSEIHRVLTFGGKFIFIEHVRHEEKLARALLQRALDRTWSLLFNGCHINRDIGTAVRNVPFSSFHCFKRSVQIRHFWHAFVNPTLVGFATK